MYWSWITARQYLHPVPRGQRAEGSGWGHQTLNREGVEQEAGLRNSFSSWRSGAAVDLLFSCESEMTRLKGSIQQQLGLPRVSAATGHEGEWEEWEEKRLGG